MNDSRVDQTMGLIRHQLWGTYVYTYVGGRNLVTPAWRAARSAGREADFFTMLFTDLLTPQIFSSRVVAARRTGRARAREPERRSVIVRLDDCPDVTAEGYPLVMRQLIDREHGAGAEHHLGADLG